MFQVKHRVQEQVRERGSSDLWRGVAVIVAMVHVRPWLVECHHLRGATAEDGKHTPKLCFSAATATKQDKS